MRFCQSQAVLQHVYMGSAGKASVVLVVAAQHDSKIAMAKIKLRKPVSRLVLVIINFDLDADGRLLKCNPAAGRQVSRTVLR